MDLESKISQNDELQEKIQFKKDMNLFKWQLLKL